MAKGPGKGIGEFVKDHWVYIAIGGGLLLAAFLHARATAITAQQQQAGMTPTGNPFQNYGAALGQAGQQAYGHYVRVMTAAGYYSGTGKKRVWHPATYTQQWEQ